MKKTMVALFIFIMLSLLHFGCSYRYGMLTIASTKNVTINMQEFEKIADGVTGESKKPIIIIIPTGEPSIEDAIEDALSKAKGELMQNVVIYYKWYYIPYIYGEYKFEVKGDVYRLKQKGSSSLDENALQKAEKVYDVLLSGKNVVVREITSLSQVIMDK